MSNTITAEENDTTMSLSFNQDAQIISVGYKDGYMFYKTPELLETTNLQMEGGNTSNRNLKECIIVERFFSSSLIIVVSLKEPRVMRVYNTLTKNNICDHMFKKSVLSVKLNRDRIVVCIEDCIYIYNLTDMRAMHTIQDTPLNRLGIIDLSSGSSLMAYPGSTETGAVHIFDAKSLSSVFTFVAHDSPLAALKFNNEGNKLATASTKGTVIRVYEIPTGNRLFEFRRGMTRCVTIHSLAFSPDSSYLASSSNTETVHVFKLEKPREPEVAPAATQEASGWFDIINKTVSAYMPAQVTDFISTERSFATARLPGVTTKNIIAILNHKAQNYVVVATSDGFVYCYRLDNEGGELDLIKQHKIGPASDAIPTEPKVNKSSGDSPPNMNDPDDFPPMSYTSG